MYKFSVITPVHLWSPERVEMFLKCIDSLANQTFKDFEWVVVDDGSTLEFLWNKIDGKLTNFKIIHTSHQERVIAYNKAFREAEGEWFVLLDSDDELVPDALEKIDKMISDNPKFAMFNFGALYAQKDGSVTKRDPFEPKKKKVGHEVFGGGNVVNGTFVFNRSVYEDLGGYGPKDCSGHIKDMDTSEINYGGIRDLYLGSPYDFAAWFLLKFPEQRKYFLINHEAEPNKIIKEIGNPWGNDHVIFYKYTRKYHSLPIKEYLYIVNPR